MARILIGTVPVVGHVNPFLPLARALVSRGHDVRWYGGAKHRRRIESTGARFAPMRHAKDFDDADLDAAFPGRSDHDGAAQLAFDMKYIFIDNAPGQLRDITEIVRELPADVVLGDPAMIGGMLLQETRGVPMGILNVLPIGLSSRDAAPFGLGLPPDASALGRLRNRALNWSVEHVVFGDVQKHWNAMRARLGLPPTGWFLDVAGEAALYMQPSVPGFEYPRSDLPSSVHFIGMLPAEAPPGWVAPEWWGELDGARPVVHVTQGTIANARPDLIAPALEGLAREDVLVVVSTGGRSIESLGLRAIPDNARIGTFLSYPELLPKTAAMVTNGGYGGVQMALSHAVPLAVAGTTEDKPEVAARVAWSGAGLNLKTATPTPAAVRKAVRSLLDDARYRESAKRLAAEYAQRDAVARAVELVEQLASRVVVGRGGAMRAA